MKRRWPLIAGTALITGALVAGAAFAASPVDTTVQRSAEPSAPKTEQLTEGQVELLKQLGERRKAYMEQFRAEAKGLVEQAVKEGKITQEQADKLTAGRLRHHGKLKGHPKGSFGPVDLNLLPEEEVRSHLERAVSAGKLSREQADQLLQKWQEQKDAAD